MNFDKLLSNEGNRNLKRSLCLRVKDEIVDNGTDLGVFFMLSFAFLEGPCPQKAGASK